MVHMDYLDSVPVMLKGFHPLCDVWQASSACASCRTMATTKNIDNLKIKKVKAMKVVDEIGEYKNKICKQYKKSTITLHSSWNVVHILLWMAITANEQLGHDF
jgi:hypothetical protein